MFEFKTIREENLPQILDWRTSEHVTRWMLTDIERDAEKQKEWFHKINRKDYWVIHYDSKPIGLINLGNAFGTFGVSWGFYIGEKDHQPVGGLVLPYFYNYVFLERKIDNIWAEVMDDNPIIKIHKFHGYKMNTERETKKNGKPIRILELKLTKESWVKDRRFKHYVLPFE